MHVHFLDPYRPGSSPVHRLDPRVKLVLAIAFILAVALAPAGRWPIYILLLSLSISVIVASELGVGRVLKRSSLALPFVFAALPLVFSSGGTPLVAIPLGQGELTIFRPGLERFASIALKSWISVQAVIVLASTTPFPELLLAMRAIRLPRLLVAVFGLTWRYLFVMVDEAGRLMRARAARSGHWDEDGSQGSRKPGGTLAWRARVTGGMAGNLFVRSLERGDRIYAAMAARGYDGEARALPLPRIAPAHRLALGLGLLLIGGLLGLNLLLGP